jgi:hypothetical protein
LNCIWYSFRLPSISYTWTLNIVDNTLGNHQPTKTENQILTVQEQSPQNAIFERIRPMKLDGREMEEKQEETSEEEGTIDDKGETEEEES